MDLRFPLTSQECEILLEFEQNSSLAELSKALGKDISVVSRNLKSIAEHSDVLEKKNGRWSISDKGIALNQWTREALFSQRLVLSRQKSIKVATTREFAARVLMPHTRELLGDEDISISIISSDDGIEKLILNGEADFGFDCGRPKDPIISFKRVVPEPFALVAAPRFIKRNKIKDFKDIREHSRLGFSRSEGKILDLSVEATRYFGNFSDIATLREACLLGYGWAILPYYTVARELELKKLKVIPGLKIEDEKFGVWWLRERQSVQPWVKRALKWLKAQNLSN
jgi:DNA-binding transcriptional LysR family regulator